MSGVYNKSEAQNSQENECSSECDDEEEDDDDEADDREYGPESTVKHSHHDERFRLCLPRKKNQKAFMIYPQDPFTNIWDIFIAFILIFSCLVTPYRLALITEDTFPWKIINGFVDLMFLFDIIIIFNTCYYDEEFNLIQDRK